MRSRTAESNGNSPLALPRRSNVCFIRSLVAILCVVSACFFQQHSPDGELVKVVQAKELMNVKMPEQTWRKDEDIVGFDFQKDNYDLTEEREDGFLTRGTAEQDQVHKLTSPNNEQRRLLQENEEESQGSATFDDLMSDNMLVAIICIALGVVFLIVCISVEISRRQMFSTLPEAEVKLHLAILKLESMQADKIAKNDFQRYNRVREEKLIKEIKNNDKLMGREVADTIDSDLEHAKIFFDENDFEEMGLQQDEILNRVSKDPMIRRNLNKHQNANIQENLNQFELTSEMTQEQTLSRNQMKRDRTRAHKIKNLFLLEKRNKGHNHGSDNQAHLLALLNVHFKSEVAGQKVPDNEQAAALYKRLPNTPPQQLDLRPVNNNTKLKLNIPSPLDEIDSIEAVRQSQPEIKESSPISQYEAAEMSKNPSANAIMNMPKQVMDELQDFKYKPQLEESQEVLLAKNDQVEMGGDQSMVQFQQVSRNLNQKPQLILKQDQKTVDWNNKHGQILKGSYSPRISEDIDVGMIQNIQAILEDSSSQMPDKNSARVQGGNPFSDRNQAQANQKAMTSRLIMNLQETSSYNGEINRFNDGITDGPSPSQVIYNLDSVEERYVKKNKGSPSHASESSCQRHHDEENKMRKQLNDKDNPEFFEEEIEQMEAEKRKKKRLASKKKELKKQPLIIQWLEDYWEAHVSQDLDLLQMDAIVRRMINYLLNLGDEQLIQMREKPIITPVTGLPLINYEPTKQNNYVRNDRLIHHENQINAVMLAIKPGILNICFSKYSKEQMIDYLIKIKNKDVHTQQLSSKQNPEKDQEKNNKDRRTKFDKVTPFDSSQESVSKGSSSSHQNAEIIKNEQIQNLSAYVRLRPSDPKVLIAQYKKKYFEDENDAEIDIKITPRSSDDSPNSLDEEEEEEEIESIPIESSQIDENNKEAKILQSTSLKLREKKTLKRAAPLSNYDSQYQGSQQNGTQLNFTELSHTQQNHVQRKNEMSKFAKKGVRDLQQVSQLSKKQDQRPSSRLSQSGQLEKLKISNSNSLMFRQQPTGKGVKARDKLADAIIEVMDDKPLFKQMQKNANYQFSPIIGEQVNNKRIKEIYNDYNYQQSIISNEYVSMSLSKKRPVTQGSLIKSSRRGSGYDTPLNLSVVEQQLKTNDNNIIPEISNLDNDFNILNMNFKSCPPRDPKNPRQQNFQNGSYTFMNNDIKQSKETNATYVKGSANDYIEQQKLFATDDPRQQQRSPDMQDMNQKRINPIESATQLQTYKVQKQNKLEQNISPSSNLGATRPLSLTHLSNQEISQRTMKPMPMASNIHRTSVNSKRHGYIRSGPFGANKLRLQQQISDPNSQLGINSPQVFQSDYGTGEVDNEAEVDENSQQPSHQVMSGEIIQFVKSQMSIENMDDIKTMKGQRSLKGFGKPVQKSHHRIRARQGAGYTRYVRNKLENDLNDYAIENQVIDSGTLVLSSQQDEWGSIYPTSPQIFQDNQRVFNASSVRNVTTNISPHVVESQIRHSITNQSRREEEIRNTGDSGQEEFNTPARDHKKRITQLP